MNECKIQCVVGSIVIIVIPAPNEPENYMSFSDRFTGHRVVLSLQGINLKRHRNNMIFNYYSLL